MVGCGGGIAAYKMCTLVSEWAQANQAVRVVMSAGAEKFITPLTFSTLARHPAYTDQDFWQPHQGRPLHIGLAEWAGVIVLAPLTANTLGKLAYGLADNLLTNTILASTVAVLLAPAMNTAMWQQLSVQRNLELLMRDARYHLLPPTSGRLACDTVGVGRMAEPEEILAYAQSLFWTQGKRDLVGQHVLISGGPTYEYLDSVRFIGNPATGKMALALARSAFHRGARVTLVHGPLCEPLPEFITSHAVISSQEMQAALEKYFPSADVLLMNAAVADVRPAQNYPYKLSKVDLPQSLMLEPVPDILRYLNSQKRVGQRVIGFAAQTGDILTPAWEKLHQKGVDALFVNPIDQPDSGFGQTHNQGYLLLSSGQSKTFVSAPKLAIAHQLWDALH